MGLYIYGFINQVNFECLSAHVLNKLVVDCHLILLSDVVDRIASSRHGRGVFIGIELEVEEGHHLFLIVHILWSLQVLAILDSNGYKFGLRLDGTDRLILLIFQMRERHRVL